MTDEIPTPGARSAPWSVDALIFDLDGTLVDSSGDIAAAANHALAASGRPTLPPEVILGYVGDGAEALMRRCLGDGTDPREAMARFVRHYREHPCERSSPYPGVAEFLAARAGVAKAIVSNKPLVAVVAVLEGLGLADSFGMILGERSLPRNKPDADPVRFVLDAWGVEPGRAVLVGDGPQDLRAGKASGVRTVAALYGFNERRKLLALEPDGAIETFGELAGWIRTDADGPVTGGSAATVA